MSSDSLPANSLPLPEGKVRLISGDGFEFIVDDAAAKVSTTLRGMLDSEGTNGVESPRFTRLSLCHGRYSVYNVVKTYECFRIFITVIHHLQVISKKPNLERLT